MYNNGNAWETCRFIPDTQELCFYEDRDGMQYNSSPPLPAQFDAKRPRITNLNPSPNAYVGSTVAADQRSGGSPQYLPPNEHCVNFNSPYVQMLQAPVAYTPPPPESPSYPLPNRYSPPISVPQFACGGVMPQTLPMLPQPTPVARQVITAAPYYNMGCNEATYAPCQNAQPWSYAYCYGYYNQQPCQFTEFVDIEDFMSNEKRKEKSRDAARCRRSRETEIFTELAQVLPLPKEDVDQLDKASVMRVAIAFLKIREMLELFPKIKDNTEDPSVTNTETNDEEADEEASQTDEKEAKPFDLWKTAETHKLLTQTLDGFLIILSNDGDVTYVSENITEYLGISKIDILGQQIWEYSHQCDHDELKEALNIKKNGLTDKVKDENLMEEGITTDHRDLYIRLKCTLTSRGRSVNIKSATYKVIHITGHLVVNAKGDRVLIAVGRPIPHPSNIEIPLGTTTFLTKHSLDMKFTYVDDKMASLFGYKPDDLLDKSLYECHHGGDSDSLMATYKGVLSKGQGETCRYRFLGKSGGYCWIVTQATIVYDKQKPQSVVCVNYVISNLENNNEIYSLAQYEASQLEKTESTATPTVNTASEAASEQKQQQETSQQQSVELIENKPKPKPKLIQSQEQEKDTKKQTDLVVEVDLDSSLLPELSKKQCVDVDEKESTSTVVELQLKREIPTTNNNNNNLVNKSEQVKYVPSVTSFRALQHRSELFGGRPPIVSTPPKYGEEKRPKSVTASVFRVATTNDKPPSIISLSQNIGHHSIAVNQSNFSQLHVAPRAQSVTASVFTPISQLRASKNLTQSAGRQQQQQQSSTVPRAVEMNKGYLSFAEDTTGLTMLKEEPDDLAHLAPTGVDACLPLDESTPVLFGEMLAGLMSYGGLLPDDINSLDSQHSGSQTTGSRNNKGHIDPFINYREESNDTNCSQHLLSPSVTSKSPEASSLPSLCSPNSLSQEDDFPFMTMNVDDDIDLSMRAPYIPMNEQDDLPLLTDDLMWGVGFTSEDLAMHKDDAMQYNTLKQQMNLSTNNRMLNSNNNNNNNCNSPNLTNSSPSASPMSISSSSAASSPSPCSSNSSLSMHNQQGSSFGGAMLCNAGGGGSGGGDGTGGGNSTLNVDDSDSGISSINSMSPQHTHHQQHQQQQQHHHQQQQQQHHHQGHNQHQQQQQQQQHHSPMSIGNDSLGLMTCKKEIDGGNLCESIDAFDSVYTKDSPNLDCWTVQELLNINSNDSSVAVDDLRQTHKQQNIIINTATLPTTTLHVPLITIQNNKNLSMNQQQQRTTTSSPSVAAAAVVAATTNSSSSSSVTTPSSLSSSNCHNNSNSNKQCGSGNLILSEEIIQNNRKLTGKVPTSNTAATIRISNGGNNTNNIVSRHQSSPKATILHTTNLAALQQGNNHKRHLSTGGASVSDSKRLKNSSTVEIQTSPHLLQQLMAPAPQKQRVVVKTATGGVGTAGGTYDKTQATSRWTNENGGGGTLQQQQQLLRNQQHQQDSNLNHHLNQSLASSASSSNSVLKNLLISGCDNIIVKTGPEIMITDDISNDSIAQLSPSDSFTPIRCDTSTVKVMRNCRSNPMIGGPGVLPSPPFPSDDSNPPGLLTMSDTESSSDSGIDDSCTPRKALLKGMNSLSDTTQKFYPKLSIINEAAKPGDVLIANVDQRTNTATIQIQGTPSVATPQMQATTSRNNNHRKSSISFMDSGNPLMTTFLWDLCNDDYNMNESDYIEDTDLVQVLNELTNDMVLSDDKA